MPVILPLDKTKTLETCFNSHCTSNFLSISNVRFAFASLDLKGDAGKEPSCWLESVVVGDNNPVQLISPREAAQHL